jgi:hypothetical protein
MRSYLNIVAAAAALTTILLGLASWALDPDRIRSETAGVVKRPINDRTSKIQFLIDNCRKFDGYLVGNSRSLILTGSELAGSGDSRFYNLATPGEDIGESLGRLRFLLKIGCPISSLVVGESVDILAHPHPDTPWYREHPLVTGDNPWLFYVRYFLTPQPILAYVHALIKPTAPPTFYYADGHGDFLWAVNKEADFTKENCKVPPLSAQDGANLDGRLPKYRQLVELAKEHHVKLVVWLTPLSASRSSVLDDPEAVRYLDELRQIPGLILFEPDRRSSLLSDFHQWHDCSHFHRAVFDQLVGPGVVKLLREQ